MRTPASLSRHPIHPMLVVFPIGLWILSSACDLIRLAGAHGFTVDKVCARAKALLPRCSHLPEKLFL